MPQEEFFALFGAARPDVWKQTPLGINYQANGFDRSPQNAKQEKKTAKRLNKAIVWMEAHGVPLWVQNEFSEYFHALPASLPTWLDEAFLWLQENRWQPCLGRYPALGRIRPSDIRITIVELPIWVPYWNKHTAGMMEPGKNGAITLVVAALDKGTEGSDELNWLRRVDRLAFYEIGNYGAHFRAGLDPAVKEYGDQPLC